VRSIQK
jgi:hypothetical protein